MPEPLELAPALVADAELDTQITTAKRYPRDVSKSLAEARALATRSEDIASDCFYTLRRKDKDGNVKLIQGPSARMAEILLHAWGNVRGDARIVEDTGKTVVAEGVFFDLERNVAVRKSVERRVTTKAGHRYGDDMLTVAKQAAISIALRNAVTAGIPRALWEDIWKEARQLSIGSGGDLERNRQKMVSYFQQMGVSTDRIYATLGVENTEAITRDMLANLRGLATAIRDGEMGIEEAFEDEGAFGTPAGTPNNMTEPQGGEAPPLDVEKVDYGGDQGEGESQDAAPAKPKHWTHKVKKPKDAKPGDTWQKGGEGPVYAMTSEGLWEAVEPTGDVGEEDKTQSIGEDPEFTGEPEGIADALAAADDDANDPLAEPQAEESEPEAEPQKPKTVRIAVDDDTTVYVGPDDPPVDAPADSYWCVGLATRQMNSEGEFVPIGGEAVAGLKKLISKQIVSAAKLANLDRAKILDLTEATVNQRPDRMLALGVREMALVLNAIDSHG